jgi:hypothetical protein
MNEENTAEIENKTVTLDDLPSSDDWIIPSEEGSYPNPFLTPSNEEYPIENSEMKSSIPTKEEVLYLMNLEKEPDMIFTFTGSIKQPWVGEDGILHAPLEDYQNFRKDYPYGAASFKMGEDPYEKDIQGTGGKISVIATKYLTDALGQDIPIYTLATFSNPLEERANKEINMPTAAEIYKYELQRFGVKNEVTPLKDNPSPNTLTMVVDLIKEVASSYSRGEMVENATIVTQTYHIPRAKSFLEACGMNEQGEVKEWLFRRYMNKTGQDLLNNELMEAIRVINEKKIKINVVGSEQIVSLFDSKRPSGQQSWWHQVLKYVYPPKLTKDQFEELDNQEKSKWIESVKLHERRVNSESKGVGQLKDGTYWESYD